MNYLRLRWQMALRYPGEWKFDGVGFGVPPDAVDDFARLLLKTAGNSKDLIERFKRSFGRMQTSSSWEWAVQDLESGMRDQAENAAAFVDAVWECIEAAKESGVTVPTPSTVNRMLVTHHIALRLEPPDLKLTIAGSVTDGPPASSSADSGHQLPFVLGEEIGRGGYGTVYKATRTTNVATFEYAVKLFEPSPFIENVDKARQRFEREIRALSAVQHRAIVQLVDAGITSEQRAYIAMPLIVGANLAVACQHGELRPILEVFVEILRALQTAHEASVIHRDLKPTNVMVRASDRQPIIVDFGASYIRDELSEKNLTTTVVGTRGYIPPEVLADPALRSNRQDVYACGAMLYQLLAGRLPSTSEYAPLEAVKPEYRRLDPVILRSLGARPSNDGSPQRRSSWHRLVALDG
jgi:hypothetical protein